MPLKHPQLAAEGGPAGVVIGSGPARWASSSFGREIEVNSGLEDAGFFSERFKDRVEVGLRGLNENADISHDTYSVISGGHG